MVQLARNYLATWFAMLAIASQVFFGMAHIAAMLAVAAGPLVLKSPDSLSFSLLQICSANGLISFQDDPSASPDNPDPDQIAKDRCPVCVSAAVAPCLDSDGVAVAWLALVEDAADQMAITRLLPRAPPQHEPIRGPPSVLSA